MAKIQQLACHVELANWLVFGPWRRSSSALTTRLVFGEDTWAATAGAGTGITAGSRIRIGNGRNGRGEAATGAEAGGEAAAGAGAGNGATRTKRASSKAATVSKVVFGPWRTRQLAEAKAKATKAKALAAAQAGVEMPAQVAELIAELGSLA